MDLQYCDNFCLYNKVIRLYICTHTHFSQIFSHVDYHRIFGRIPCAIRQVPTGQSFHRPQCAYNRILRTMLHNSCVAPCMARFLRDSSLADSIYESNSFLLRIFNSPNYPHSGRYFRTFIFVSSVTLGSSSKKCHSKSGLTEVSCPGSLSRSDLISSSQVIVAHCILKLILCY